MFNFFRKSKKETDKKNKEPKEAPIPANEGICIVQGKEMCKNKSHMTNTKPEIAPEINAELLPNYSPESVIEKNVPNTISIVSSVNNEKNEANFVAANPDIIATMCENSAVSYANVLKKIEPLNDRRSSNVKPCGHGTTAISPRIPVVSGSLSNSSTPSASPVLEVRKQFRISGIENITSAADHKVKNQVPEDKDEQNTVTASMKLHVNLPVSSKDVVSPESRNDLNMKSLINQEAKFQSQLNDLTKQLSIRDAEAGKLKFEMEELQRDVFAKSAGMNRLETELSTAHKECETIRQRIRFLENELENYRTRNNQLTEQLAEKSGIFNSYERDTKGKIEELESIIKDLRKKIESLEEQLNILKVEKAELERRHAELIAERDEQKLKVAETLEETKKQKQDIEKKWKDDFEKLRTVNILKEQQLLDDFEWKLRDVQLSCRKRLEDKDEAVEQRLQAAYEASEKKMEEAEKMMKKIENIKTSENEIQELRGIISSQEKAMQDLREQQEQMKLQEEVLKSESTRLRRLIEIEKENLQHIQRMHNQEILDKERTLKQTLNQKRIEIAMYWEERLLNECGRLKSELEQIHNEEKCMAMESVRKQKDESFNKAQNEWEKKLRDCLKEVASLKKSLITKDAYYREELVRQQTATDQDILELRRLMDKIDMSHHDKYEKLVLEHDNEIGRINEESEKKIREVETYWQNQMSSLRSSVELVKEQMEKESQKKIELLIQKHRNELDEQWDNLIRQKSESIQLLEEEYVSKYKTLEEQFYTQQKSHTVREVELLKTIDALKNELQSKESTIDDLQNNVNTLDGGVQVLNQEIAQQGTDFAKSRRESDLRIRGLLETLAKLQGDHEKEKEVYRLKFLSAQKQAQETIEHLQKKCRCLTKLFEEVRQRYERRESRQDDLNTISDLRQVIAEQEKDLACINEEKRYFQMKLMALEKHLEDSASVEDEEFEDAHNQPVKHNEEPPEYASSSFTSSQALIPQPNGPLCIPPTIPECDDCDD